MNSQQEVGFKNVLGIRARLFAGFGTVIIVLLLSMGAIIYKISIAEDFANKVVDVEIPTHDAMYDLSNHMSVINATLQTYMLTKDSKYKDTIYVLWNYISQVESKLDALSEHWSDQAMKNKWNEVKGMMVTIKNQQDKFLSSTPTQELILTYITESVANIENFFTIIDGPMSASGERKGGLFDNQYQRMDQASHKIIGNLSDIRNIEYLLLGLSVLISLLIFYFTTRGIVYIVNNFRKHSNKVASGDLTQRIDVLSNDEMGQLGDDLNRMTEGLSIITKQITEASHSMVTMLEEVKHAVNVQSSGATEQASSINQITASLAEIEKSSTQTIEKAKDLGDVAERTREKGQLGLEAVEQSVEGMKAVREKVQAIAQTILDLSNKTQQVGEITAVVNNLAQQSKMLALNASIEAAKAGESGRGFAVVASEVKNLAEQSEQSTAQVQKILEDIRHATEKAVMATEEGTKGVDVGTKLVEQTGEVVRSLSDVIHETTIATQQIEAAVRQESVGIEQITAGMNEIHQVTSSFVESVAQTTEAINNLTSITKNLKEYVDVYKT